MLTKMKRQNYQKLILPVLAMFLICGIQSLIAAPKVLIGKVDLKSLVLLHPAMRNYNPYMQAFKVDASRVPRAVMKQQADEHKGELHKLQAESRLFQGRIHELRRNHNREAEKLANNYLDGIEALATGPRALKRKEYDIARNRKEAAFHAKLQALSAKLGQTDDRIAKLEKISYNIGYTDPETTQKQFASIINELRQYTKQIASKKGIEVVLNSKSRDLKALSNQQARVLAPELDYSRIFAMPFPNEIRNDAAAISGYYQNLTSLAENWLAHGSNILQPFSTQILDNDIFIGGTDLTAEVLAAIFRRYKIDNNVGNAIIQSIYSN